MNMKEDKKKPAAWPGQLMLILLLPLLIPLLLCIGVAYLVATILIYLAVWIVWNTRGIRLVYVYSNSPHWQGYIEKEILPRLPDGQIVMNWSERQRWKYFSLASVVFHKGDRGHVSTFNIVPISSICFRKFLSVAALRSRRLIAMPTAA